MNIPNNDKKLQCCADAKTKLASKQVDHTLLYPFLVSGLTEDDIPVGSLIEQIADTYVNAFDEAGYSDILNQDVNEKGVKLNGEGYTTNLRIAICETIANLLFGEKDSLKVQQDAYRLTVCDNTDAVMSDFEPDSKDSPAVVKADNPFATMG